MVYPVKFSCFVTTVARTLFVLVLAFPLVGCLPEVVTPPEAGPDAGDSEVPEESLKIDQANYTSCSVASDCASGYCVDRVCCDSDCSGVCVACTAAKKGGGKNGVCGPIAANTNPDNECVKGACNGSGACAKSNGQTCAAPADCLSGRCVDGVCCDSDCSGVCVACTALKKGGGKNGVCGPIATNTNPDNECVNGACNGAGACAKSNGQSCAAPADCVSGSCVDGVCCDNACTGVCVACTAAKKGGGLDGTCGAIAINTNPDNECVNGACNGAGACVKSNGQSCAAPADCVSGSCADGVCCDNACTGLCEACTAAKKSGGLDGTCGAIAINTNPDNECVNGACSGSGSCIANNGQPCAVGVNCVSGHCADGVCCDNACTGLCEACTGAQKGSGVDGTCGPIAADTNPDFECINGSCNGAGACISNNGQACASSANCVSGHCVDGVCCSSACSGLCEACTFAKKGSGLDGVCGAIKANTNPDNECVNGVCNGMGACAKANGQLCASAADCASGNCTDGVCCNAVCLGTCFACSAAKKGGGLDGVCDFVASGSDPDNECAFGSCSGTGVCVKDNGRPCSNSGMCASGYCVDGVCCENGCAGVCQKCATSTGICGYVTFNTDPNNECANGACNGQGVCVADNGQACTSNAMCISGWCVDGVCCNYNCNGPCEACSTAKKGSGSNGTCGPIAATTDPDNECVNGSCNGAGACLADGVQLCSSPAQCASGHCVDGVCCDTACNGECVACTALIKGGGNDGQCGPIAANTDTDWECVDPYDMCNGQGACSGYLGKACSSSADCILGHCVDGVCCNTACNGVCVSCLAAQTNGASNGYCGPIKTNTDPNDECVNGTCNGAGVCISIPAGGVCQTAAQCATGFCVDGVCCTQSSCTPVDSCHLATCSYGTGLCADYPRVCPGGGTCTNGLCPGECTNTFGFHGLPKLPLLYSPNNIAMGDTDGDGDLDLVVTTFYVANLIGEQGLIGNFLNDGTGRFVSGNGGGPALYNSIYGALIVADMNNDGYGDAIETGDEQHSPSVLVRFSTAGGLGGWSNQWMSHIFTFLTKVVAVDLNNDGYKDIVGRANNNFAPLYVLMNSGGTAFGALTSLGVTGFTDFDAADLNGDGQADLLLANSTTGMISVRFGNGNNTFGAPVDYPAVTGVNAVKLWDLDTDGQLDLVASDGTTTMVMLNLGNGVFALGQTYAAGSMDIGDTNGDGYPDIVASTTLFNNGNGTFTPTTMDYVPSEGSVVGDLNGDGKADLARFEGGDVQLTFNLGNGSFTRPHFPQDLLVDNNKQIVSVDLNSDNLQDLALLSPWPGAVGVRISNGNGTYAPQIDYPTSAYPLAIAAADMNGDGFLDLVTSGSATVTVLLNNGGGTFAGAATYPVSETYSSLVAADLNGDGHPDVAGMTSTTTLKLMFNNGNGTLGTPIDGVSRTYQPAALAVGDLNADGHIDLVSMSTMGHAEVYINNGNGGFGTPTDILMIDDSGVHSLFLTDLNGDGALDVGTAAHAEYAKYVSMMLNNGDGTFRFDPQITISDMADDFVDYVTAADIDGNGYNDVIVRLAAGGLRVYLNNGNASFAPELRYSTDGGTFIATDVDGDGVSELLTNSGALHARACYP